MSEIFGRAIDTVFAYAPIGIMAILWFGVVYIYTSYAAF